MTPDKKTAIILVNYNQKKDIQGCLDSIYQCPNRPAYIVISDNGSNDGSIELIKSKYENIMILLNRKNIGFAAASNTAVWSLSSYDIDYILLLNSDTVVTPDFFPYFIHDAKKNDLDIAGPKILYYDQPDTIWFAGGFFDEDRGEYAHRLRGTMNDRRSQSVISCDFITGCALLIKKKLFERLNGFDPGFFMYCEDLDLCLRARYVGAKIGCVQNATLYHKVHDSRFEETKTLSRYYFFRNMLYTIKNQKESAGLKHSHTKPLLRYMAGSVKTSFRNFRIGLAGSFGIIDFIMKRKGTCRPLFLFIFKRLGYLI